MIDILAIHPSCAVATNRAILRELILRGLSVELVVAKDTEGFKLHAHLEPRSEGDPVIHALDPIFSIVPSRKRSFAGLRRLIADKRPRFVWIEDEPASLLAWQLGMLKSFFGFELICFSVENMSLQFFEALKKGLLTRFLRHKSLSLLTRTSSIMTDRVLVCSNDGQSLMQDRGFSQRVVKMPIGFDPSLFRVDLELRETTRNRIGLNQPTIAYFGRLIAEKGIVSLIQALGQLQDLEWQFLLDNFQASDTPFQQELKQAIAKAGIQGRIVSFDATHSEMPAYMNAADIVVVASKITPTFKEQYGRVVPESLACGCEVVVTNAGALPELVKDAGIVIDRDEPELIAKALRRILTAESSERHLNQDKAVARAKELNTLAQADLLQSIFLMD